MLWHVVEASGIVQSVSGEAVLSHAQEVARKIEHETGVVATIHQVEAPWDDRPHVGQPFSMWKEKVAP